MSNSTVRSGSSKTRWSRLWLNALQNQGILPEVPDPTAPANSATMTNSATMRIKRLEVLPGEVQAEVQGRAQGLCLIQMKIAPLTEEEWKGILEIIGRQTTATAVASTATMSLEVDALLNECVSLLLPRSKQDIDVECRCQEATGRPCPALGPVYRQLGAMFDEEPWLFFRLRGRDWQQILQTLQARSLVHPPTPPIQAAREGDIQTAGTKPPPAATDQPTSSPSTSNSLLDQTQGFWGSSKQMDKFHHHFQRPITGLTLLRRLGPLPLGEDEESFYTQLAAIYRTVTEEALTLAFAGEDEKMAR